MNREKELVKNTIILGLGRFLPKLVSVITLPIVTACLTKNEYGTYDLITTLVSLLLPVATLQVQSAAFRFLIECRGDHNKSTEIITNIYAVVFPISCIVSALVIFFIKNLSLSVKIVTVAYFFLDSIQTTQGMVVRGLGKNKVYSINAIILSVVNGLCIVLCLKLKNQGLFGIVFSLALANLLSVLFLCVNTRIWEFLDIKRMSKTKIQELISYSWPMVPNNLSTWILKLSDRFVITAFLGLEANAVYAVANKIPNLLSIAQSVLIMAWQENASIAVNDKDASVYYTKMFDRIFTLMIGCTAVLIGFTPVMFKLLIRGDYSESYVQMPLLILGMFFCAISSFQGGIYIAHKRTKSIGYTTIIAAIVNIFLDLLLIRWMGITAGSISTLVAYLVLYILRMIGTKKFQPVDYKIKKQLLCYSLIIFMLFICFLRNYYLNILNAIFGFSIFFIINTDFLKMIFNKTKSLVKK